MSDFEKLHVTVVTQAWNGKNPVEASDDAVEMVGARVFINGKELDGALGAQLDLDRDRAMVLSIQFMPSSFTVHTVGTDVYFNPSTQLEDVLLDTGPWRPHHKLDCPYSHTGTSFDCPCNTGEAPAR